MSSVNLGNFKLRFDILLIKLFARVQNGSSRPFNVNAPSSGCKVLQQLRFSDILRCGVTFGRKSLKLKRLSFHLRKIKYLHFSRHTNHEICFKKLQKCLDNVEYKQRENYVKCHILQAMVLIEGMKPGYRKPHIVWLPLLAKEQMCQWISKDFRDHVCVAWWAINFFYAKGLLSSHLVQRYGFK